MLFICIWCFIMCCGFVAIHVPLFCVFVYPPVELCAWHQTAIFTIIAYCLWTLLHSLPLLRATFLSLSTPFLQSHSILTGPHCSISKARLSSRPKTWYVTSVDFDLNMQGLTCNQVQYVCIEFAKGPNPTTIFNHHRLYPTLVSIVSCSPASCEGLLKLSVNSLTLFPLGYFEDLSPLGGGGWFGPPPSDLGN